jgi:hypothetical protein
MVHRLEIDWTSNYNKFISCLHLLIQQNDFSPVARDNVVEFLQHCEDFIKIGEEPLLKKMHAITFSVKMPPSFPIASATHFIVLYLF